MTNLLSISNKKDKKASLFLQKQSNAEILVNTLIKLGVTSVFGYPGASVLSIYNELSKTNLIKHFLVRHEQAALHAAEGYARISGKTGVVLVTSGPGFTNTITGIANAYADSTPLVVLAGDVSSSTNTGKIFQDVDIVSLTKSCCKKSYKLTEKDDIAQVIENSFIEANSGVKGPVVIALPRKILESEYKNVKKDYKENICVEKNYIKEISKLSNLINSSKKPLILVGGGCVNAFDEVVSFATKLNCPVVSTLMGIGNFPTDNSKYIGMIGLNGALIANTALNNCDLLISLGVAFSDRTTCKDINFARKTKIVSVNLKKISRKFELEIIADIKQFLNKFMAIVRVEKSNDIWQKQIDAIKEEFKENESISNKLHSSYVLKTLSTMTQEYEPIVVTDVGQHQMLTAQFFKFNKPRKFITSGGLGTMGFGLPAAIGVQIAQPNNLILNITGDGSFQMNLQELATCREHNIPVKIIIMNNGYLGMVRQLQEKIYFTNYQVEMENPDFTKIAEAYDLFAIRVTKNEELVSAINRILAHSGTAILDIKIDSFENI